MKNNKYRMGLGFAFNKTKDVKMLNNMAAKGYSFVSVNALGIYKFEKTAPSESTYIVDYSDLPQDARSFETYLAQMQENGWTYVYSLDTIHWFRAPRGTSPARVTSHMETDRYANIYHLSLTTAIIAAIVALFFYILARLSPTGAIDLVFYIITGGAFGMAVSMGIGAMLNRTRNTRRTEQRQ